MQSMIDRLPCPAGESCLAPRRVGSVLVLVLPLLALTGGPLSGLRAGDVWVDPESGIDGEDRGSFEAPLRTLGFALGKLETEGGLASSLLLGAGAFVGGERLESLPDTFPLVTSGVRPSLAVVGCRGEPASIRIDSTSPERDILRLEIGDARPGEVAHLSVSGVRFTGGRSAVALVGADGVDVELDVESCDFTETEAAAIEILSGHDARTTVRIVDCRFEGPGSGLAVEAVGGARVELTVERCRFAGMPALDAGGLLGGAIELHVDEGGALDAAVRRCELRDTAGAFLLSSGTTEDAGGALRLTVASTLVHSTPPESAAGDIDVAPCRSAFYLATRPGFDVRVDVLHSTFWGVSRSIVHVEDLADLTEGMLPVRFDGNVFAGGGVTPLGAWATSGSGPVPPSAELGVNLAPEAWRPDLPGERGIFAPPRLVDPGSGDYRPAPDSPAIDAGDASLLGDLGTRDLDGRCRLTSPSGGPHARPDLGAYEASGVCAEAMQRPFVRGDCDAGGAVQMTDAIYLFGHLFLGVEDPPCADGCDANDDGSLDITDGIYTLSWLFLGGGDFPSPWPGAGADLTPDRLGDCLADEPAE